jgi:ABC-type spermidine/putrescine transport system permease subunit II
MVLVAILAIAPFVVTAAESTVVWKGIIRTTEHSLDAYGVAAQPARRWALWKVGLRSLVVASVAVAVSIPMGSIIRTSKSRRLASIVTLLLLLPFLVSVSLRVFGWRLLLQQGGYLQWAFNGIGQPQLGSDLLFSEAMVRLALVASSIPVATVCIIASLPMPNDTVWRVADECGCTGVRRWLWLTIPLGVKGIIAGWFAVFCLTFGASVESTLLGRPEGSLQKVIADLQNASEYAADDAFAVIVVLVIAAGILMAAAVAYFWAGRLRCICVFAAKRIPQSPRVVGRLCLANANRAATFWCITVLAIVLAPIVGVVVRSLEGDLEGDMLGKINDNAHISLAGYGNIFEGQQLENAWFNSVVVVGLLVGLISSLLSFVFASVYWWRSGYGVIVFASLFFMACIPPDVYAMAVGHLATKTGINRWPWPLVFSHLGLVLPYCVAASVATASQVPGNVLSAGMELSGGRKLRVLFRLIAPLMISSFVNAFTFGLLLSVNDYCHSFHLSGSKESLARVIHGGMSSGTDSTVYAIGSLNIALAASIVAAFFGILHMRERRL